MKKRILSALLVLCLACGLVSAAWAADSDVTAPVTTSVTQNADETDDSSVVEVNPTEPTGTQNTDDTTDTAEPADDETTGAGDSTPADTTTTDEGEDVTTGDGTTDSTGTGDDTQDVTTPDGDETDSAPVEDETPVTNSQQPAKVAPNGMGNNATPYDAAVPYDEWDYTVEVGSQTTVSGSDGRDTRYHQWALTDGSTEFLGLNGNTDSNSITVTGLKEGTATLIHTYQKWRWTGFLNGQYENKEEYVTVHVTPKMSVVYVYVASNVTDANGNIQHDSDGNVLSWASNSDFLEQLGLAADTVDGNQYFPVGQIELNMNLFKKAENGAYLNSENDWEIVKAALQEMDTSTLTGTSELGGSFTQNRNNNIKDYINQIIEDLGKVSGSQCSALFEWTNSSSNGFSQNAQYHLDLRFTTSTITFVAGNNGITAEGAADGTTLGTSVYITGSTVNNVNGVKLPDGYTIEGYYTDQGLTSPWSAGQSLTNDLTLYVKIIEPQPLVPGHQKYVKSNGDGTYDLTLDVTGSIKEDQEQPTKIDILYVLDLSTSMKEKMPGSTSGESRLEAAVDAINALEGALKEPETNHEKSGLDIRHSYVGFSGSTNQGNGEWVDFTTSLGLDNLSNNSLSEGTRYEMAMQVAKSRMDQVKNDDTVKVIIFISDGDPDWYTSGEWKGWTPAKDIQTAGDTLKNEIALSDTDYFYAIGVGDNAGKTNLEKLISYATVSDDHKKCETNTTATSLVSIFEQLASEMTRIDCSNIVITDTFSQYAQLTASSEFTVGITDEQNRMVVSQKVSVTDASSQNGYVGTLTYWVHNETGATTDEQPDRWQLDNYTEHTVPFTLTYNSVDGTFSLSFGNTSQPYALENGWTYSITTTIEPTEEAYTYYRTNGNYPDKGDKDTDAEGNTTSSDKDGFYSNSSATLNYKSNGVDAEQVYDKPVIQVYPKQLTINKTVTGLNTVSDDYKNSLQFTVKSGDTIICTIPLKDFTSVGDSATQFTYTVEGLMPNTTYTVSENVNNVAVDKYVLDTGRSNTEIKTVTTPVCSGADTADQSADFTNVYKLDTVTLTVQKFVRGNMSRDSDVFSFTLTLTGEDDTPYTDRLPYTMFDSSAEENQTTTGTQEAQGNVYSFNLSAQDYIRFTIPAGLEYTITEMDDKGYTDTFIATGMVAEGQEGADGVIDGEKVNNQISDVLNANTTWSFTNVNVIEGPVTGLERHDTPFVMMIGAAGIAGLALIGSIVARRVRRRREE